MTFVFRGIAPTEFFVGLICIDNQETLDFFKALAKEYKETQNNDVDKIRELLVPGYDPELDFDEEIFNYQFNTDIKEGGYSFNIMTDVVEGDYNIQGTLEFLI